MIYGVKAVIKAGEQLTPVSFDIAHTPAELVTGVRGREEPEENCGMLLYPPSNQFSLSLWMRGVPFDMDVLFLLGTPNMGWIVQEIHHLTAFDETSVTSTKASNAALEMNSGFGSKVTPGSVLKITEASAQAMVAALHQTSPAVC